MAEFNRPHAQLFGRHPLDLYDASTYTPMALGRSLLEAFYREFRQFIRSRYKCLNFIKLQFRLLTASLRRRLVMRKEQGEIPLFWVFRCPIDI